jgi:hypothetical protein
MVYVVGASGDWNTGQLIWSSMDDIPARPNLLPELFARPAHPG